MAVGEPDDRRTRSGPPNGRDDVFAILNDYTDISGLLDPTSRGYPRNAKYFSYRDEPRIGPFDTRHILKENSNIFISETVLDISNMAVNDALCRS